MTGSGPRDNFNTESKNRQHFVGILLFLLVFFIYVKWHFFGLPYAAAFLTSIIIILIVPGVQRLWKLFLLFCLFLISHTLFTSLFNNYDIGLEHLKSIIYSIANFIILAATLIACSQISGGLSKHLRIMLICMLILAILEIYIGMRPVFEDVRLFFNSTANYTADARDEIIYGRLRPMIFTTEPSSAGNFFGAIWLAYVLSERSFLKRYFLGASLFVFALYLFRSPTLIGYLAVFPGFLLLTRGRYIASSSYFISIIFLSNFVFYYGWINRYQIQFTEIATFFSTGSFYIRQISPIQTVLVVLENAPLFGYGVNYFTTARDVAAPQLFAAGGFYTYEILSGMPDREMATNAFWELFGMFGVLGFLFFTSLKANLLWSFGIRYPLGILLGVFATFSAHAGVSAAFTWTPLIFVAMVFLREEKTTRLTRMNEFHSANSFASIIISPKKRRGSM